MSPRTLQYSDSPGISLDERKKRGSKRRPLNFEKFFSSIHFLLSHKIFILRIEYAFKIRINRIHSTWEKLEGNIKYVKTSLTDAWEGQDPVLIERLRVNKKIWTLNIGQLPSPPILLDLFS